MPGGCLMRKATKASRSCLIDRIPDIRACKQLHFLGFWFGASGKPENGKLRTNNTQDLAKNDFLKLESCIGCADQK
jgi:hypothetical protein